METIITLDIATIGETTRKGILRELQKELKANNQQMKTLPTAASSYRVQLRREETQLIKAIARLNHSLASGW
jgi:hypothetical protein